MLSLETTFMCTLTKRPETLAVLWLLFYTQQWMLPSILLLAVPCPPLLLFFLPLTEVHSSGETTGHITSAVAKGATHECCEINHETVFIKKLRKKGGVLIWKV